jgi:hypothetical protein
MPANWAYDTVARHGPTLSRLVDEALADIQTSVASFAAAEIGVMFFQVRLGDEIQGSPLPNQTRRNSLRRQSSQFGIKKATTNASAKATDVSFVEPFAR